MFRRHGADQLADRPVRETGDRPVGVADHPVTIDDEHAAAGEPDRAERPVGAGDRLVRVGQQREVEPPCLAENRSWLAMSWAEMASTWAPRAVNCSSPSL